jgi:hypothetical protein
MMLRVRSHSYVYEERDGNELIDTRGPNFFGAKQRGT